MPKKPHNFRALSKPKAIQKHEHRHYWPYIPVLLFMVFSLSAGLYQSFSQRNVLSYATSLSNTDLLYYTNNQRLINKSSNLALNNQLTAAAQAKANDMVSRNYWSHNTPEGLEPWIFISNAGYSYQKAGENLAYGFKSSSDTVNGWMNSPSHKANLLDSSFTEVGFGYANSPNFHNSGAETVVVAMYGRPQTLAAAPVEASKPSQAVNTSNTVSDPETLVVSKAQTITKGYAPWVPFAVGLLAGISVCILLIKQVAQLRHIIAGSERFILRHPVLDTALISFVIIATYMAKTVGFIR